MTFDEWWTLEFGHPPLPEQRDLLQHCQSAFRAGQAPIEFDLGSAAVTSKLVCTACGAWPAENGLLPLDAKPGDQCPMCFHPDMDCDGTLMLPSGTDDPLRSR